MSQTRVKRWVPLEANPEVWNKIIHKLGVSPKYNYVDVYGFDPELLAMIPAPVEAMIFLFPLTETYEKYKSEEAARLLEHEQNIDPEVVFFKQTIENACGMIALLHSIANSQEDIAGSGLFHDIIEKAKGMSVEKRVDLLENCAELATVHESAASQGQTEAPDKDDDIDLHFICFVKVGDHLYEMDGRKSFPIYHGKCTNLVEGAVEVMQQFMARDPEESNFSAIALCKTENE
ncbi:uncharacterized protein B0P05DRAFT_527191 [Gilbertella persicaria]|uniref:Ubiquitin carboxyl-terminal hydrolase n=1 Tax=Rhizopus stolonifer TaxID=4846 RepID=A0A367KHB7_RHIST|nr:uncharacterized protein B0P05DRAFT_527191 [Gilbertella persicaria]KAI8091373.1 hypothetical protein B0P05DRAFT_527191 [Gilbertella persicaria]RCI01614.1 Ubiquitin carboxyl-terminal hydrolase isozyme L3 [Rhizopus stolonifer]